VLLKLEIRDGEVFALGRGATKRESTFLSVWPSLQEDPLRAWNDESIPAWCRKLGVLFDANISSTSVIDGHGCRYWRRKVIARPTQMSLAEVARV
jgi:hypothetical protein